MKYRHGFHAGNFADVHKHVALLALLASLQRKERGFLYIDTHAGAGAYDLSALSTHRGAEARHGVAPLLAAAEPAAPELRAYRDAIRAWREHRGSPQLYPGSALLAAQALRPQDRALCCERLAAECRSLERALAGLRRVRVACEDGYRMLVANLPPPERRSLILIDPPYESPDEIDAALAACGAALARLSNAVIAVWYPIKDERWLARWQARCGRELDTPALLLELWLYPRDARLALNGSGLLLLNPPYRFDERARVWQAELGALLDRGGQGGHAVRRLAGAGALADDGA